MVTQLPVRIEFSLPAGWRAVDPDKVNAPGSAFVAVYAQDDDGFTPNITIAGNCRPGEATLDAIADESVQRMQRTMGTVRMRDRKHAGSPEAPGLSQVLDIDTEVAGRQRELVQTQVYVSVQDVHDPVKRVVLEMAMTSSSSQHSEVIDDFQQFVRTVRPEENSPG